MAHAYTRGMPGILEIHDGHENIHILAQINVSLWLKWKKLYCFLFAPILGYDTKLKISLIHNMFK